MSVNIRVKGLEKLNAKLKKLGPAAAEALNDGLVEEAGNIMNEAQNRVPVVTGRLRSSAFIRDNRKRTGREISLGYEAPYAQYVHEIPYSGKTTKGLPGALRNGKGYKWLEKAANKALQGVRVRLINKIRAALSKGRK